MRIVVLTSLLLGSAASAFAAATVDPAGRSDLARSFEEHVGQEGRDVQFLHRGPGYAVRLSAGSVVVEFPYSDPLPISLDRASRDATLEGIEPFPGRAHGCDGADPSRRRTDIPLYGGVRIRGLYPGTDLEIRSTDTGLALRFGFSPEADPAAVRRIVERMGETSVANDGRALLKVDRATATLDLHAAPSDDRRPTTDPVRLAVDKAGHRYVAGRGREPDGTASAFVAKFATDNASLVWVSRFTVGEADRIAGIGVLEGGRVAVHGQSGSDAWIATVSSDGAEVSLGAVAGEGTEEPPLPEVASPWGPATRIDATITAPDGVMLVAGTTSASRLEGATIVGPTDAGDSAFLSRAPDTPVAPLAAGCPGTINFDNSAGTGLWATATNWDLDRLPIVTDDVCIGPAFTVTLSSGTQSVQSLTTDASSTLTLSAGTLTLASASTIGGPLTMSGGTLDGAGEVTISGTFTWNGGALAGGGTTHASGGIAIGGTAPKDLNPRTLDSPGTVTWSSTGTIRLGGGSSIQNGGTWIAQSDTTLAVLSGGGTFTNSGTFRKSAGAGTTTITTAFNSPGTIEIQSGTLSLNGNGTASSPITGSGGTTLRFNGASATYTLGATSSVSMPTVIFDAGTINVNGIYAATSGTTISGATANFNSTCTLTSIGSQLTISAGTASFGSGETVSPSTMTLSGGTLTGTDTVTISGLLTWTSGAMAGGGITNAAGGISASGGAAKDLNPRVLKSPGTTTWAGTGVIRLGGGASIENSGTWDAQGDAMLTVLSGGGTFTNSGTFRKSAGAGTTTITTGFDSPGGIEIQSGTLSVNGNGTASGTITGSGGTTLRFNGPSATYTLGATSSVSVPTVIFDAGTVNVNGAYAATSETTISGATANFNPTASVTSIGSQLTISGGTASFGSGETIAPSTMALSSGTLTGTDTVTVPGLLTWTGGAMAGGGITNADGGISMSGSAAKDLNPRVLHTSGTTTWAGAGAVRMGSGASIGNSGTWDAQGDAMLTVLSGGGTFTNSGTFRKSAGAGTTTITTGFDSPGGIEIQSGTLSVNGNGTASGTITGSGGTTLRFSGAGAIYTVSATSSISVPTVAFDTGTVNVNGAYAAASGTTIGGATANFNSTCTLTSIGSQLTISAGTASFGSGETIAPTTMTLSSGTLTGTDTVTVSGLLIWTSGAMAGGGITNADGGISMTGAAAKDLNPRVLRSSGTTTWEGTGIIRLGSGASIENSGTWDAQNDASLDVLSGGGTFSNIGTFRKSAGGGVSTVAVPFANSGAVEALTKTLAFTAGFTQTAGSTTLNGGILTATAPLDIQAGSLRGTGTTGASVTSSGTTSPGLSPAILGIGGNWTQSAAGTYAVELGGTAPGTQHDRLDVASVASLDGTLNVTFIGGFTPVFGDTFTILTGSTRTGTFATTNLPALPALHIWNVKYGPTSVELKVLPVPSARVPGDLVAESPLKLEKSGADLTLNWGHGCLGTDTDSEIYEGIVGSFTSHAPVVCSTGGATTWTFTPGGGNRYYLVVPTNGAGEGSYGLDGTATERIVSTVACRIQSIAPCP